MAINLDNVKAITHNNKEVIKIEDSNGNVIWKKADVIYYSSYSSSNPITYKIENDTWSSQSWNYNTIKGNQIWTDGTNIFWNQSGTGSKVLNQTTMEWEDKSWPEFSDTWNGDKVLMIEGNIYYVSGAVRKIYDKTTGTWSDTSAIFSGLPTTAQGADIWYDGENYYWSAGSGKQYVFNKQTQQWVSKTWNGFTSPFAYYTWTDGTNVYLTNNNKTYYLNKATSTWTQITSNGTNKYTGTRTFKYDGNIYLLENSSPYEMYKLTSSDATQVTWTRVDFTNHPTYSSSIRGDYFWSLNGRVTASCVAYTTK